MLFKERILYIFSLHFIEKFLTFVHSSCESKESVWLCNTTELNSSEVHCRRNLQRDALECVIDSSSCGGNLYRRIGITIVGKQLDFLRRLHRGTRPRVCESWLFHYSGFSMDLFVSPEWFFLWRDSSPMFHFIFKSCIYCFYMFYYLVHVVQWSNIIKLWIT